MLKRLYADNYRCFVNFEFPVPQLGLLIGGNGAGKSTLFDVLWAIRDLARYGREVQEAFPFSTRTRWDQRGEQRFELEVGGNGGTYVYALELEHVQQLDRWISRIKTETVSFDHKPLYRFAASQVSLYRDDHSAGPSFPLNSKRSFLSSFEPSPVNQRLVWLLEWIGGMGLFRIDPQPLRQGWVAPSEVRFLARDAGNFAGFYRYLVQERPEAAAALQKDLQERLPGFRQMRLLQLGEAKGLVVDFTPSAGTPHDLAFADLSDGQAVMVVLYALLHARAGQISLLCLDEPDNFLALGEIQPWLVKLSDLAAESDRQALIASHNPAVIDYLAAESVSVLSRPGGGPARVTTASPDVSKGVRLSDLVALDGSSGG